MTALLSYECCTLCPRMCRVDRRSGKGFCGCGDRPRAARAALHAWEEPCLSGPEGSSGGSGAVFFSGCTLRCRFCQNHSISSEGTGRELSVQQLARIFLELQEKGAYNINLVTPTQYLPSIIPALDMVRDKLHIPVVCNCGGYERTETVQALRDYVDIWLPDLKYFDSRLSRQMSGAEDYFACASAAVAQMIRQTGPPVLDERGLMRSGVIIRHMVLPGHRDDSLRLLSWMRENLPEGQYLISLLSQYTPIGRDSLYPELNRRITSYEYDKVVDCALSLGLTQGFLQKKSSAREEYTPPFNLEGLPTNDC